MKIKRKIAAGLTAIVLAVGCASVQEMPTEPIKNCGYGQATVTYSLTTNRNHIQRKCEINNGHDSPEIVLGDKKQFGYEK
tara:strand:- start:247 stop:486 length:240 start_codon:yes stop_codon:yes gene_type:complete